MQEWQLRLATAYPGGRVSFAAQATTADGRDVVFEISLPEREARGEAEVLRWWDTGTPAPGNVLSATRRPWLIIDPKPMIGDPGYDLCPLLLRIDDPLARVDPADRLLAWSLARSALTPSLCAFRSPSECA